MTFIIRSQATEPVDLTTLVEAVLGNDPGLPKGQAMSLLLGTHYPQSHRVLQEVLQNPAETTSARALAVRHLGLLPWCTVREILLEHAIEPDAGEQIHLELVRVLGRIGDETALPVVERLAVRRGERLRRSAAFAKMLIAYRADRNDHSFTIPEALDVVRVPTGCRKLAKTARPGRRDFLKCVDSLGDEPVGIEYSDRLATTIDFGEMRWMVLGNRELLEGRQKSAALMSSSLLGVVAEWDFKDEEYYLLLLILSTPAKDPRSLIVHLHEPNGGLKYLGRAIVRPDGVDVSLRTVSKLTLALELDCTLTAEALSTKELSYMREQPEKHVPDPHLYSSTPSAPPLVGPPAAST